MGGVKERKRFKEAFEYGGVVFEFAVQTRWVIYYIVVMRWYITSVTWRPRNLIRKYFYTEQDR